MSTIDLSKITGLTVQISSLNAAKAAMTDPAARSLIDAQISMLSAQLAAEAQHAQSQSDAQSNILDNLGLFSTLTAAVGSNAPSIIALFKH
jgi:FlxA-like protein